MTKLNTVGIVWEWLCDTSDKERGLLLCYLLGNLNKALVFFGVAEESGAASQSIVIFRKLSPHKKHSCTELNPQTRRSFLPATSLGIRSLIFLGFFHICRWFRNLYGCSGIFSQSSNTEMIVSCLWISLLWYFVKPQCRLCFAIPKRHPSYHATVPSTYTF